jgi:thiol-disulfide isomerase/thioredoxin
MSVFKATDADFESVLSSSQKTIVKYYADWCGSCKLISPKYKRLSDDERFTGIQFLEVNAEENELARKKDGVSNLPFFAIFQGGNLIEAASTSKEDAVISMLQNLN